jgi:hypothetical protein
MPRGLITLVALALAGSAGCGSGSKTYPVNGRVVFKGGKAVTDGRIQFQSTSNPEVRAVGEIQPDGTFSLATHKDGKSIRGAVEGQHKVVVELERPAAVVVLATPYTVEPRENNFTIEVQRPRR